MMISVIYVTLNEADKLRRSLLSLSDFADEIIVLDLGSTDNILQVAKKFKAKIFKHPKVEYVELVRNYSINLAKGDWILILDPDEVLNNSLKAELSRIAKDEQYMAVNIPRKNIMFGEWISHSNFWPDRQIRFFRKGVVDWPMVIHTYPKVVGVTYNLPASEDLAIDHYCYDNKEEFLDRQKRYSTAESLNRFYQGKRFSLLNFLWKPTREFLVRFVKYQGYLDGYNGLYLVTVLMYYQIMVEYKLWKLGNMHRASP